MSYSLIKVYRNNRNGLIQHNHFQVDKNMDQRYAIKKLPFWLFIGLLGLFIVTVSEAQIIKSYSVKIDSSCQNDAGLAVITADKLPYLLGQQNGKLSLYTVYQQQWRAVVFQIDHKDPQGRYIITPENDKHSDHKSVLGRLDELVFRKQDLGQRLSADSEMASQFTLLEVEVQAAQNEPSRWLYINIDPVFNKNNNKVQSLLMYDEQQDVIISPIYKTGFSRSQPFLMDSFHWQLSEASAWSVDISDMMKIRHKGKFLGLPFKRSHADYSSQLVGVKKGPLRVIRRTENRVKVFWKLKTPALYIDYIMMPDGFVMDTMIDIPFKISFFFSHLETLTTMDWNHTADLPTFTIHSDRDALDLPVNGRQTADKNAFNQIIDSRFSVSSSMGRFDVNLEVPDDFPVQATLFLNDALQEPDPPENFPGQFGNVGFKTTGWEKIDSRLHHLKFIVCMKK